MELLWNDSVAVVARGCGANRVEEENDFDTGTDLGTDLLYYLPYVSCTEQVLSLSLISLCTLSCHNLTS